MISLRTALTGKRARLAATPTADLRSIGDAHRDAMQWSDAADAYSSYLEANPGDTAIWVQAGNCFKEAGNFAKSLAAYRRAEQLKPDNFDIHLQLGHLYKIAGNLSDALAAYQRAAALKPETREIKQEIKNLAERLSTAITDSRISTEVSFASSIEELLAALRRLPPENDPFTSYFKSVSEPDGDHSA